MAQAEFQEILQEIAAAIGDQPLNSALAVFLEKTYPGQGEKFERLSALCKQGESEGWLMAHKAGGVKFGRAIKPGQGAENFSVDVVRMKDVVGPHHIHTTGEIGAIMPISGEPKFDGMSKGWYVYPPGSDHNPTVTGGDAYVLYLLPDGKIEFTGK